MTARSTYGYPGELSIELKKGRKKTKQLNQERKKERNNQRKNKTEKE